MFYNYRQNNSGGSFSYDKKAGISVNVIVECDSAKDADQRAEEIGLYFDGCDNGRDCDCCGDRWSRAWDKLDKEPSVYGEVVEAGDIMKTSNKTFVHKWMKAGQAEGFIHYKNGKVAEFWSEEQKTND